MDKAKAIKTFGSVTELAAACDVTPSAVSQWPDPLPRYAEDKVLAAILRAGRLPPAGLMDGVESSTAGV